MAGERLHGDDTTVRCWRRRNRHRTALDLRARRQAVWRRPGRPRRNLPLLAAIGRGEHPQAHLAGYAGTSSRRTPMTAYNKLISQAASPARSGRRRAGYIPGVPSSPWPTSRRTRAARLPEEGDPALADRHRGGAPDRRCCDRAVDQRQEPEERLAVRRAISRPQVDDLMAYMREQAAKLSRGHDLVKAIQYMLKRWPAFTLFLDDGRVCMSNNAAERGLRCTLRSDGNHGCSADPTAGSVAQQTCTGSSSPPR